MLDATEFQRPGRSLRDGDRDGVLGAIKPHVKVIEVTCLYPDQPGCVDHTECGTRHVRLTGPEGERKSSTPRAAVWRTPRKSS
jgi:hypothetical protein